MRPDFRIEANGQDITGAIRDRLVELRVRDESGGTADTLEITVDDRGRRVPFPPAGCEFRVWVGYRPPGVVPVYMGKFKLDEVGISSGPRSLTIRAKAGDMGGRFRAPATRSWHDRTIGEIVREIAEQNGMAPRVAPSLAGIRIEHIDQTEESDAAFLTRLASRNGAVAKPADGSLLFVPRGEGRTASGAVAPIITVHADASIVWRATFSDRGRYAAVETYWQDNEDGERHTVRVGLPADATPPPNPEFEDGEGDGVYRDALPYATEEEARRAAEAILARSASGRVELSLDLPGRPEIFAEARIVLVGFRPELDGTYSPKSVEHSLTPQGYSTRISAEVGGGSSSAEDEGND